ncbi:AIPR family protein [Verrucosispora sp. WMMD573]|uniref:AIPR family protein n=1 Tax=Verrucosispora sp. WMMD573 TaxID=3015149 RepID=UPI00248ADA73|nr:AIPR family protein [Verrucosispora sp. WMMD573]WBB56702.1 AIPR family protein [Verrucosispora sp. WMMD573]
MSTNDIVLLGATLERERKKTASKLEISDFHTFFFARQYLKAYSPTHDDLLSGLVDGGKDCGIDGIYVFVDSLCIRDDEPVGRLGRRANLDLIILQVKNTSGFAEPAIDKLALNLPKLLDFGRDEEALAQYVNPKLIEVTRRFLETYKSLDLPQLRIFVAFASLRATHLHPQIEFRGNDLCTTVGRIFGGSETSVQFLGAGEVCALVRDNPPTVRRLQLAENPISTDKAGGYVGVVRLDDYERFITGPAGDLDAGLFEANVRDYEGETAVNRSIQQTLEQGESEIDFWWLNNGVTIVASRVQPANKMLELDSPQIVNGLQTSTEIYKRKKRAEGDSDSRSVLVKVIEAPDDAVRDRIIRATNSQTAFGPSVLRATDLVQRQIEEYLLDKNLFYERRRRHYFNRQFPVDRIVSIDAMGQAVLSATVQTPHVARKNAGRVFDEDVYELVFHPGHPLAAYHACVQLLQSSRDFLSAYRKQISVEDFQYQLTMLLSVAMTRKNQPTMRDVAKLEGVEVRTSLAKEMFTLVQEEYDQSSRISGVYLLDQLAKDEDVTKRLLERGRHYLRSSTRSVGI